MTMTISLMLACVWAILANVIAMFPSKRAHWPAAYGLIALGVPLLGYVTYENGPWIGLIVFAAGVSILRWPVIYLGRWIKGAMTKGPAE
jgi:membrane protease YdiL (CAAX protease family)|tara:strand:- start:135939 stop:136205 length:267 start_codon:yes stop_codon:yes gene_type:complete